MAVVERTKPGANNVSRGVLHTLTGQWVRFMVQVVSVVVLARMISPAEYGLFAMVAAIAALAIVLSDSGLTYAAVQAPDLTRPQQSNLFWLGALVGAVATLLVLGLAPALAAYYDEPRVVAVVWATGPVFLLSALSGQFRVTMSRQFRFAHLATCDVASQVAGLTVALVVALLHPSVWALVAQQVTTVAVGLILVVVTSRWVPGPPSRRAGVAALLRYSGGVVGDQLLGHLSTKADTIALGRHSDIADVGVYARMYQLFAIPLSLVAAPLTRVAIPHLSRADEDAYAALLVAAQRALAYAFLLVYSFVFIAAEPLVAVTVGDAWVDGASVLAILAVGGAFQGVGYVYYWIFLSKARMGLALRIALVTRLTMVALVFSAGPWGPEWVAVSVAVATAFTWLLQTTVGMPRAGVAPGLLLRPLLRPMMLSAVVVVSGLTCRHLTSAQGAWQDLGVIVLSSVAVVATGAVVSRQVRHDLLGFVDILRTRSVRRGS